MSARFSPRVSIVIPCRNERDFIAACLDSILANDYPQDQLEIWVVDGISDDGTRAVIEAYEARFGFIKLLDNPQRITPTALNVGIAASRGDIVMRMDVHVSYPQNYISGLVAALIDSGADNVGGLCSTEPGNDTLLAKAIAVAMSHPFGVGNSYFRIGVAEPRWVDTVPFGCYRREVFDRIGMFDEELIRNQDDEFNARLIKYGGRILLVPSIVSRYFARPSLAKLWRMYFQYGYFKPLVVRKLKSVLTLRQLIPGTFVAGLVGLAVLAVWSELALWALAGLVAVYLAADIGFSQHAARQGRGRLGWILPAVFPILHFGYGIGFLKGLADFFMFRRETSTTAEAFKISR